MFANRWADVPEDCAAVLGGSFADAAVLATSASAVWQQGAVVTQQSGDVTVQESGAVRILQSAAVMVQQPRAVAVLPAHSRMEFNSIEGRQTWQYANRQSINSTIVEGCIQRHGVVWLA